MSVTGRILYNKLCELRPDLSSAITPEILNKICEDSNTQPFLEWLCENVNHVNILSNEEIRLKNTLQDAGEWLEGEALDAALEEATKDCQDLLQLVSLDDSDKEDLFEEHKILKESCREDEEYIYMLEHSIKNLKKVENKLDDSIEEEGNMLNKEQIKTEKISNDCSEILRELDKSYCQFSKDIDVLLNVYADAAKNQGNAILWSQMPTDLFIKQIELYNHYLGIQIKKQFGNNSSSSSSSSSKEEQDVDDSDYASIISDKEKQVDEKMHELSLCKKNLTHSKVAEINANVQEKSYITMLQYIQDIYNGGVLKVPRDNISHNEVLMLSTKRDILEQNINLLLEQQYPEVAQFAEMETLKILKNDALVRLERRKMRLETLKNLYSLAAEHGHVYVNLLCILMEMQYRNMREVTEFIADARHHVATEYKLSSTRCEIMQQQQEEYVSLLMQSSKIYNVFNQILISMMGDNISDQSFVSTLKKYDDLIIDNAKKTATLETCLSDKIDKLQKLEKKIDTDYKAEIQTGPTNNLKPISHDVSSNYEEVSASVQELQADVNKSRNQLKERMRTDVNLEREKDILWQRFLADPEILRQKYEEASRKANKSHFGDT